MLVFLNLLKTWTSGGPAVVWGAGKCPGTSGAGHFKGSVTTAAINPPCRELEILCK